MLHWAPQSTAFELRASAPRAEYFILPPNCVKHVEISANMSIHKVTVTKQRTIRAHLS